jgi:hypothetical protein
MIQSVRLYVYLREKRVCTFKRVESVCAEERGGRRQREGQGTQERGGEGRGGDARRGEGRDAREIRGERMLGGYRGRFVGCCTGAGYRYQSSYVPRPLEISTRKSRKGDTRGTTVNTMNC